MDVTGLTRAGGRSPSAAGLAERTPFALDWDRVSAEEWNQASAASMPPQRGQAPLTRRRWCRCSGL
jgi:hypothetical protein